MSIQVTPLWKELKKYVMIQIYGRDGHPNPRFRDQFPTDAPRPVREGAEPDHPVRGVR